MRQGIAEGAGPIACLRRAFKGRGGLTLGCYAGRDATVIPYTIA